MFGVLVSVAENILYIYFIYLSLRAFLCSAKFFGGNVDFFGGNIPHPPVVTRINAAAKPTCLDLD